MESTFDPTHIKHYKAGWHTHSHCFHPAPATIQEIQSQVVVFFPYWTHGKRRGLNLESRDSGSFEVLSNPYAHLSKTPAVSWLPPGWRWPVLSHTGGLPPGWKQTVGSSRERHMVSADASKQSPDWIIPMQSSVGSPSTKTNTEARWMMLLSKTNVTFFREPWSSSHNAVSPCFHCWMCPKRKKIFGPLLPRRLNRMTQDHNLFSVCSLNTFVTFATQTENPTRFFSVS